jgi:hypothetical protein
MVKFRSIWSQGPKRLQKSQSPGFASWYRALPCVTDACEWRASFRHLWRTELNWLEQYASSELIQTFKNYFLVFFILIQKFSGIFLLFRLFSQHSSAESLYIHTYLCTVDIHSWQSARSMRRQVCGITKISMNPRCIVYQQPFWKFFKLPSYLPWRDSISRPIAPISSVACGDDTTRPRRQGIETF